MERQSTSKVEEEVGVMRCTLGEMDSVDDEHEEEGSEKDSC